MITQGDVLELAETAGDNGQRRLKEILLAVAGMIDDKGRLVDEPDEQDRWIRVMATHGQCGRGYRAVERRKEAEFKSFVTLYGQEMAMTLTRQNGVTY